MALAEDLQVKQTSLDGFVQLTQNILNYLPAVVSNFNDKGIYKIGLVDQANTKKFIRPINKELFVNDIKKFKHVFDKCKILLNDARSGGSDYTEEELFTIDRTIYTIQQSIGAGLDLLVNPNAARKHVGNRFEELVKCLFDEMGVANGKTVLQIPYETDEGIKVYKCENDLIISPFEKVRSTSKSLDQREIVISIKTTSKDRMGKIFIDKMLLERFVGHKQKVIGVFLNDVQRKDEDNISFTLVSGLFMVYTSFLTELEGVYYLDPPPNARKEPFNKHMKPFSHLIARDLWKLLSP